MLAKRISMNENIMNQPLETDWTRTDALTNNTIDTSDIPPMTESFVKHATLRKPRHPIAVTLSIDADVLAWFKAQEGESEPLINAALRIYVEAHKAYDHHQMPYKRHRTVGSLLD